MCCCNYPESNLSLSLCPQCRRKAPDGRRATVHRPCCPCVSTPKLIFVFCFKADVVQPCLSGFEITQTTLIPITDESQTNQKRKKEDWTLFGMHALDWQEQGGLHGLQHACFSSFFSAWDLHRANMEADLPPQECRGWGSGTCGRCGRVRRAGFWRAFCISETVLSRQLRGEIEHLSGLGATNEVSETSELPAGCSCSKQACPKSTGWQMLLTRIDHKADSVGSRMSAKIQRRRSPSPLLRHS